MVAVHWPTTVSLVTWNGARWLPYCLASLAASTNQDFFLMVVDNASIDGSADLVADFLHSHPELAARARLVRNRTNLGFARAHNQSLTWTNGDFVFVLNQDVILTPAYLATLVDCLGHDAGAAAAMGKLRQWRLQGSEFYLGLESTGEQVIDSVGLRLERSRKVTNLGQGQPDRHQFHEPCRVFGVPATAALFRRAALIAVSAQGEIFDEDFVSYKEDVDLAWRLQWAGYDSWYLPQAIAYHDRSLVATQSLAAEARQRRARPRELKVYSWVNHLATLVKNEAGSNLWRDLPWLAAHELGKLLFLLATDPKVVAAGGPRLFSLLPRLLKKRRQLRATHRRTARELRSWWRQAKVVHDEV